METIITKSQVADAVYAAIPKLACVLPADIEAGLAVARELEGNPRGRAVLDQLIENAAIAAEDRVPICQDTGTVWVSLEIGPDVAVRGDVFADVDDAVARAYDEARLRKSVVRDAVLDRANTGDNTPAFCDVHPVDEPGAARLHVMLKGGGSDNASRVVMLVPGAGKQGIVDELVRCVREKGANACPPLVVGVGIGSTFDKVAGLAKRALMRPVDEPAADDRLRALEEELLAAVNATGIGPGGLGGRLFGHAHGDPGLEGAGGGEVNAVFAAVFRDVGHAPGGSGGLLRGVRRNGAQRDQQRGGRPYRQQPALQGQEFLHRGHRSLPSVEFCKRPCNAGNKMNNIRLETNNY